MTTVKVQCACGQKYAFDVEPIHGRMPIRVSCPSCGADGTEAANAFIEQTWVEPEAVPAAAVAPTLSAPPPLMPTQAPGLRISGPSPPVAAPPPIVSSPAPPMMPPGQRFVARPAARQKGKDGWDSPEEGINKMGTWIVSLGTINAALLSWGMFGNIEVDLMVLCAVVALVGAVGGALNVLNRGPVWMGAVVGLVSALGGFLTAYFWMHGKRKVWVFEVVIATVIGYLPGFGLQWLFQKMTKRR